MFSFFPAITVIRNVSNYGVLAVCSFHKSDININFTSLLRGTSVMPSKNVWHGGEVQEILTCCTCLPLLGCK